MENKRSPRSRRRDVVNVSAARANYRNKRRAPFDVVDVDSPGDREQAIVGVADLQESLVTTDQLRSVGLGASTIHSRVAAGRLHPVHRCVYLLGRRSLDQDATFMAATLATHPSLLTARSSLVVWGALPPDDNPPAVLSRRLRQRDGIHLHRTTTLGSADLCALNHLPLAAPARSLLDFAPRADPYELETALNELRAAKLLVLADLEELRGRTFGHHGWGPLGRLLTAETEPGFSRKEAERRLLRLIRSAALPHPRRNARIGSWEVDLFWPEAGLVVEVDSYAYHSSRRAFERDRRKQTELQDRGLEVLRFTWLQITQQPEWVVARIAARLAARSGSPS